MRFDGFLGNARAKELISGEFDRGRVPHAVLIDGPQGSGRRTLAGLIARAALCEGGGELPCGQCRQCRNAVRGDNSDIAEYSGSGGARSFSVGTVREIRMDAALPPNDARRKAYILTDAQDMTKEAQNALLKILEEPPEYVVFILTCDGVSRILETVRSRCFGLALGPLGEGDVIKALHAAGAQAPEDKLREAARCSGGIVGRALGFLAGEGLSEAASAAGEFSKLLCGGDEYAFLKLTAALAKDPAFTSSFIGLLPSLFRDAQAVKCGAGARLTGCDAAAQTLAHGLSGQCVDALCAQALGAQRALESNVRRELLLTGLFSALWSRAHDPDAV
jgi:DNA polymerase-3 subunit delta'